MTLSFLNCVEMMTRIYHDLLSGKGKFALHCIFMSKVFSKVIQRGKTYSK